MTTTLICGDLHGKIEVAKELLEEKNKQIIFVGDYLDSFDRSIADQIDLLDMILDAVKTRSEVTALMGNHELSYLVDSMRASGWKSSTQAHVLSRKVDMQNYLEYMTEAHGYLITHAGVSASWLDNWDKSTSIEDFVFSQPNRKLWEIGYSRGGTAKCGGPLWCDYYEEFQPIEGVKQIFGHTARREFGDREDITWRDSNYNIDCLDRVYEILELNKYGAKIKAL